MMSAHPRRARALCPTLLSLALVAPASDATTLAAFDFDGPGGGLELSPETLLPGLLATPWRDDRASLTDFTGVSGRALGARDWLSGNRFVLQFSVPAGMTATLTGVGFSERASASGPNGWLLSINGEAVGQGATGSSYQARSIAPLSLALQGSVTLALEASGASSDAGTWRIDDVVLEGSLSAVPLPPAGLLFAAAAVLTARRSRRRAGTATPA